MIEYVILCINNKSGEESWNTLEARNVNDAKRLIAVDECKIVAVYKCVWTETN